MNKNTIEYLAYLLNKAHKEEGREKAIVFLGAGTSVSAGIPLTNVIVRHIKKKFRDNPIIKEFTQKGEADYYKLMGALTADERRDLFHFYVTRKRVKLNITNIYLAQLLKLGYVDYIVTVNFDDLILKACTLYNFLPPVYDISNIKTITTTDIRKNSVIYLHGQYFGQWLLNNPDELGKVEDEVLRLFNAIKTRRTWVIVGYSGNDGIFDKIKSLGSFSSELFWVKKKLDIKHDEKIIDFLQTENLNANKIEGYYADSFFLKLHTELSKLDKNLKAPEIISKPFTFVKSVLQSINEIKEDDELNDNIKQMLVNCNERIDKVITEYENAGTEEYLKQQIIEALLQDNFSDEQASSFECEINSNNYYESKKQLAWYYNDWGVFLLNLARLHNDETLFIESMKKYERAIKLDSNNADVFYNWGNTLVDLAKNKNDKTLFEKSFAKYKRASNLNSQKAGIFNNWGIALLESAKRYNDENLHEESIEKFEKAAKLDSNNSDIFYNWGTVLSILGKYRNDEKLLLESIEKFSIACKLDSKNVKILINWGITLINLAKQQNKAELYKESIEIFKKASEIDAKNSDVFIYWGTSLSEFARHSKSKILYTESIEKYKIASQLGSQSISFFNNWGTALIELGKLSNNDKHFKEALEVSQKVYKLQGSPYNLSCAYALLSDKENALKYLKETLDKKLITIEHINEDVDWETLRKDEDYINLINQYK